MHFTTLVTGLLVLGYGAATPLPVLPRSDGQACAADIDRLASGIQQNIFDQQGESYSAQQLIKILQSSNGKPNMDFFMGAKAQLLAYVNAGIGVRQNNQAIAPTGNPAIPGLAIVCPSIRLSLMVLTIEIGRQCATDGTLPSIIPFRRSKR
jgi:hypothetical protein